MRTTLLFNDGWLFLPQQAGDEVPDSAFEPVTLPHSNRLLPHHNFDDREYQFISSYRRRFTLPEPLAGRRLYVDFAGAMLAATVSINGHRFPEHRGGYTPFSLDLTDYLDETGENLLTVHLDSSERPDIPPFGHTVDYLAFGGIYRDVHLRYVAPAHIRAVQVQGHDLLTDNPRLAFRVHLQNEGPGPQAVRVQAMLEARCGAEEVHVLGPGQHNLTLWCDPDSQPGPLRLWSPAHPQLYNFHITLHTEDGTLLDTLTVRSGLRQAEFREDGFYLNGERLQLRGLNRHQTYPCIGAAAPARLQRRDADIIRHELGCNIVRTAHYPQSPHFLDRCDEIGLLVFEEIPGWQHIGDADWQELALRDVRAMIERDWNHPSIILWGVRINESWDHTELYTRTNALARELDPTRQTGGVRFFQGSEFLEDVYTLNDFSNDVQEPQQTPHLVTEFNGHMFPTKSWDHDARLVEHALRHARIQARAATTGGVSGAIGWCAFDYNTHREFGAGDRICYHGVMDIFRLPKYAAHFYASQVSPRQRVVLQAASNWRLGDVDEGQIEPLVVFSNCDEVEAYVGELRVARALPDREHYPGLPHPPFLLRGLGVMLAQPYGDLRLVGYIDGQPAAEQHIASDGLPQALLLEADDTALAADGTDMTRLAFRVVDRCGHVLRYAPCVVSFELAGPAELIGLNPFPLVGGGAALYLRAGHQAGTVTVRAHTPRLPSAEVTVHIEQLNSERTSAPA